MIEQIKSMIETWRTGIREIDLKELALDSLEALAFSVISILEKISEKTESKIDDEIVLKLKEWADKINKKKDRT